MNSDNMTAVSAYRVCVGDDILSTFTGHAASHAVLFLTETEAAVLPSLAAKAGMLPLTLERLTSCQRRHVSRARELLGTVRDADAIQAAVLLAVRGVTAASQSTKGPSTTHLKQDRHRQHFAPATGTEATPFVETDLAGAACASAYEPPQLTVAARATGVVDAVLWCPLTSWCGLVRPEDFGSGNVLHMLEEMVNEDLVYVVCAFQRSLRPEEVAALQTCLSFLGNGQCRTHEAVCKRVAALSEALALPHVSGDALHTMLKNRWGPKPAPVVPTWLDVFDALPLIERHATLHPNMTCESILEEAPIISKFVRPGPHARRLLKTLVDKCTKHAPSDKSMEADKNFTVSLQTGTRK